jgi:hypothetical protein
LDKVPKKIIYNNGYKNNYKKQIKSNKNKAGAKKIGCPYQQNKWSILKALNEII